MSHLAFIVCSLVSEDVPYQGFVHGSTRFGQVFIDHELHFGAFLVRSLHHIAGSTGDSGLGNERNDQNWVLIQHSLVSDGSSALSVVVPIGWILVNVQPKGQTG